MQPDLVALIGFMVVASVLAIAAKRVQVPYNVALVVGGMGIAVTGLLPGAPRLEPGIVFLLALPALLFEGGITSHLDRIRQNAVPIGVLSTLGMVLAIGTTGTALHFALELPWISALLLGALLSVTDTVSILFAFRREPTPPRLAGIMEGESLFNDGTALVAFGALVGLVGGGAVSVPLLTGQVVLATVGGGVVGVGLGLAAGLVLRRAQEPLAEIMVTTALAYAAYLAAERIHVSGVIAAVAAALATGVTLRRYLPPQSRIAITSFWEYAAFGVNTFLFLSVGLGTSPGSLYSHLPQTMIAVGCVFAGRAAGIYLPFALLALVRPTESVPLRWQHVFVLGNIKGALSIALALGLPAATPNRELLVDVAFGVTFVSLVVQGLALPLALRKLGLVTKDEAAIAVADQQASLIAARAARAELDQLHAAGLVSRAGYDLLRSETQVTIARAERELRTLHDRNLAQGARLILATRRRLVDAERTALVQARLAGLIPEETATRLLHKVDERILALEQALEGEEPADSERDEA